LESEVDYRRKRGMLEEINRAAKEIETEEKDMQDIRNKDALDQTGPVDLPVGPGAGDTSDASPAGAPAPPSDAPPDARASAGSPPPQ
jgi:hypothetical protein